MDYLARLRRIETDRLAPTALPAQIEGGVADHAQQPGLERTTSLKTVQMGQGLDEAFLNRVEGVGFVAEQAIGHMVRRLAIAAEQLVERLPMACRVAGEQLLVAGAGRAGCGEGGHDVARSPWC